MVGTIADVYTVAEVFVFAAVVFAAEEAASFVIRRVAKSAGAGPTVLRDARTALRLVAAGVVASTAVTIAGLSSLFVGLSFSAILALAVSLALQNTLSNVISGILLFNDGVLRLGDTIEYSGKKGKVVRLGLRNTWIQGEDGHLAIISNTALSSGPLVNHTATGRLTKKYAFAGE